MSIDTEAVIIAGLPFPDLDEETTIEYLDTGVLTVAAPFYDAPLRYCVIGITVQSVSGEAEVLNLSQLSTEAEEALVKFKALTGLTGKLFLGSHVS